MAYRPIVILPSRCSAIVFSRQMEGGARSSFRRAVIIMTASFWMGRKDWTV